jgi:formylglycine-generating enzyme required for sulfatase activity
MNFDVFISYSSKDKPSADAACAMLESAGIRCWIAPRDIRPGHDWDESIVRAIDQCRAMVLIFTQNANDSKQVGREVKRAFNREVPVIPMRVENAVQSQTLSFYLDTVHWLDAFTPPLEQHLKQLSGTVKAILDVDGQRVAASSAASPRMQESARSKIASRDSAHPAPVLSPKMLAGIAGVLLAVGAVFWILVPHQSPLKPKDTFKDCVNCPEMVVVPPGSFTMGSPESEPWRDENEGPQHVVTIPKPFAVGKFTVTFDEWDACVADGGCNGYRPEDAGWGRGRQPVINVSWNDAGAYVSWLNKKTGKDYRLLSESEWEYAARAGTTTAYYWGAEIGKGNANCNGCGSQWDNKRTAPAGSFAPNAFGLYDMAGNVWQWVADCYADSYKDSRRDGAASTSGDCSSRVLRGGSWSIYPRDLHAAYRYSSSPGYRYKYVGFRLARTLDL